MINVRVKPDGEFLFAGNIEKDPSDVIDLVVDYTQYFKTDAITSIAVVGTNVTIDSSSETDNIVTIFMSGGEGADSFFDRKPNASIKITVSSATRTLERTLTLRVYEK